MTRDKLMSIAIDNIKAHPETAKKVIETLAAADYMSNCGIIASDDEIYEEAYKIITYEKARAMTNQMFRDAGMPL